MVNKPNYKIYTMINSKNKHLPILHKYILEIFVKGLPDLI